MTLLTFHQNLIEISMNLSQKTLNLQFNKNLHKVKCFICIWFIFLDAVKFQPCSDAELLVLMILHYFAYSWQMDFLDIFHLWVDFKWCSTVYQAITPCSLVQTHSVLLYKTSQYLSSHLLWPRSSVSSNFQGTAKKGCSTWPCSTVLGGSQRSLLNSLTQQQFGCSFRASEAY